MFHRWFSSKMTRRVYHNRVSRTHPDCPCTGVQPSALSASPIHGMLRFAALVGALAVVVLFVACARKAPGPFECNEFARQFITRALRIRDPRALEDSTVLKPVNAVTSECIRTPYDHELLDCVAAGQDAQRCGSRFLARHPDRLPPALAKLSESR